MNVETLVLIIHELWNWIVFWWFNYALIYLLFIFIVYLLYYFFVCYLLLEFSVSHAGCPTKNDNCDCAKSGQYIHFSWEVRIILYKLLNVSLGLSLWVFLKYWYIHALTILSQSSWERSVTEYNKMIIAKLICFQYKS